LFRDNIYDLELETGEIISMFVYNKKDWNSRHKVTPLYRSPYIGRPFFTSLLLNEPRYQELLRKHKSGNTTSPYCRVVRFKGGADEPRKPTLKSKSLTDTKHMLFLLDLDYYMTMIS